MSYHTQQVSVEPVDGQDTWEGPKLSKIEFYSLRVRNQEAINQLWVEITPPPPRGALANSGTILASPLHPAPWASHLAASSLPQKATGRKQ